MKQSQEALELELAYLWMVQNHHNKGAKFLKELLIKYDIIENKGKRNGTTTHKKRKPNTVL